MARQAPIVRTETVRRASAGDVTVRLTVDHAEGAHHAALRVLREAVRDLEARVSRP